MSFIDVDMSRPVGVDMDSMRSQGFGMVQFDQGDAGQVVNFRWERVMNHALSARHGRPFFERKVFVTIHPPGERLNIIDREIKESDKHRWPRQWNQFQQNKVQVPDGTPVNTLFPNHPEISGNLEALGVYTVEQLARLSGAAIDSIGMGAQDWVNKANQYLERAKRGVDHHQIEEMKRQHESEMRSMHNTIADLNRRIGQLMEILNDQPVHVRQAVHETGVHGGQPYPYSAPADGSAPHRPSEMPLPVREAPAGQDFVGMRVGSTQFVEPKPGFFVEETAPPLVPDLQGEMIDNTHASREAEPVAAAPRPRATAPKRAAGKARRRSNRRATA